MFLEFTFSYGASFAYRVDDFYLFLMNKCSLSSNYLETYLTLVIILESRQNYSEIKALLLPLVAKNNKQALFLADVLNYIFFLKTESNTDDVSFVSIVIKLKIVLLSERDEKIEDLVDKLIANRKHFRFLLDDETFISNFQGALKKEKEKKPAFFYDTVKKMYCFPDGKPIAEEEEEKPKEEIQLPPKKTDLPTMEMLPRKVAVKPKKEIKPPNKRVANPFAKIQKEESNE